MSQCKVLNPGCTGREGVGFHVVRAEQITPVDGQYERVSRARIGDGPGQSRDTVFDDGRNRIQNERWCHVVDRDIAAS